MSRLPSALSRRLQAELAEEARLAGASSTSPAGQAWKPSTPDGEAIVLILDVSGSMARPCGPRTDKLDAAQEASIGLIDKRLEFGMDDEVALIAFASSASLIAPFTPARERREEIVNAIRSLRPGGATNLWKPLDLTLCYLQQRGSGKAVHLVMLTDGCGGNPVPPAEELKRRGAILEIIGVGHTPADVAEPILKQAASVVNGKVLYRFIHDADEMVNYFANDIAGRLVK